MSFEALEEALWAGIQFKSICQATVGTPKSAKHNGYFAVSYTTLASLTYCNYSSGGVRLFSDRPKMDAFW